MTQRFEVQVPSRDHRKSVATRRKAVVTGASSGIGKATALRLASEGYDICLNAIANGDLEAVFRDLSSGHHLICPGDYSDPSVIEEITETIRSQWGRLDVLINNAGLFSAGDPVEAELEEWRRPLDLMLNGAILITRALVPLMRSGGRVIHVTSIHGMRAEKGAAGYSMAKAAINQYCRALAVDLAFKGILVNAVAPGFISTPMSVVNGVNELETEWFRSNYVVGHHLPLSRAGEPEEVAGVIHFLAGPDASYITGQVIAVDGGLTITF